MIKIEEQPLVTVAMVTYNSEKYVDVAIQSVLSSSYTNFELIISDDASTDNTWNIIQSYKDKRIRAYQNETNITEYPNRNKCIDLAKGKYFIFIDGDDILYPHGLENYVFYFEQAPDCGMVIQRGSFYNIVFPIVLKPTELFGIDTIKSNLLTSSFVSNMFNLNKLKKIGGLPEKFIAGDSFVRLKIAMYYNVMFIAGINTWPRETPGQASEKLRGIVGLLDSYNIITNLISISNKHYINDMLRLKLKSIVKQISREYLKSLLKLEYKNIKKIKGHTKINLRKALQLSLKQGQKDNNSRYTAKKPLLQKNFFEMKIIEYDKKNRYEHNR